MVIILAVLVVIVALVASAPIAVFILFPWLAKENILFTTVREGTIKAIMRGGSFDRFIMSFEGYHLNTPGKPGYRADRPEWEVLYHGKDNTDGFGEDDAIYDDRPPLLRYLGLYWVGWPWANSVYVYQFEWNETYTEKETGKEKVLPRPEATDFIFVSDFTYAIVTDGAETKDRLSTDILTLATVAVRNPYRALFSGQDWMRRITAAINRHVRNFVGGKGYDDLISITKEKDSGIVATSNLWAEEFSVPIIKLSNLLADETEDSPPPRGLHGRYGVEIRTADLQTVELAGIAKEKLQTAATKVYTSEQDAKATRLTGQAEADVIAMRGKTEAEALQVRLGIITANGDAGALLAQLDALQEASKGAGSQIIWANNPLIPMAEILKPGAKGGEK